MSEPDLLDGALQIARVEYPQLDVDLCRGRIEEFAGAARGKIGPAGRRAVERFNAYFFDELGFHGNAENYYDPRNSYLNDVIERRTGIPITLAALYCEVARRAGLRAHGVGFPGHFLAKCILADGDILVDCFNARTVSRDDCQALLDSFSPGGGAVTDDMLEIASSRDILSRMLNNLRRIHAGRGDFARAVRWIDMDLALRPESPYGYRERGMLYVQMEQFGKAQIDLERYVAMMPDSPDLPQVREQIQLIRKLLSHLN
ncbi:MAG: tetratricopeptide repeat protein [Planctomycetaceae bacterium]|nr:tetratricopeptide repeat protein [Planctomycetaceae bacterium]